MAGICLCMIVRDEARVLERCVDSVRGLVDRWVICDTGSTDGTPQLATELLGDLPGKLHHHEWVDFGHNRNRLLAEAAGHSDLLLLLDADMTVEWEPGARDTLTGDAYHVRVEGSPTYWMPFLVRDGLGWRYVGVTHEYLTADPAATFERTTRIRVQHHTDSGTRSNKLPRDEALLRPALERDPDDKRATFYLAQTLRDLGRRDEAVELYLRRAAMGGWDEEVFIAELEAGRLLRDHDWQRALPTLLGAWERRPHRAEPLYELAFGFRTRDQHHAAHLMASTALTLPMPDDLLFVDPWIYRWGVLFEYSVAAWWVGDRQASLEACDALLAMDDLPDAYRQMVERNRTYAT